MKRGAWLAAFALALGALPASARPSLWDRIRDPVGARVEQALTLALRARTPDDVPVEALPAFEALLALRAATVLRMEGGAGLPSPEVWFFLGDALIASNRGGDEEGRALLRRALEARPGSPEAGAAWFAIAIASNRLRDFESERAAYTEALGVQWDRDKRAGIFLNRGESSMSLHDLRAAQSDYRTALALTSDSELHALAAWGLAVALARDDDLPDALTHAYDAASLQFRTSDGATVTALELPGVFFTPDYEITYYQALGEMALAERATLPALRRQGYERAVALLRRYEDSARRAGDPWLANAENLRRYSERRAATKPARGR